MQVDDLFFRCVIAKLALRSLRLGPQLFFLRSLLQDPGPVSDPREAPIETTRGWTYRADAHEPDAARTDLKAGEFF